MWWTEALQICGKAGEPTGRWRLTAKSDEGGGGPYGDESHDHPTPEEAESCERCLTFVESVTGMPRMKKRQRGISDEMIRVLQEDHANMVTAVSTLMDTCREAEKQRDAALAEVKPSVCRGDGCKGCPGCRCDDKDAALAEVKHDR